MHLFRYLYVGALVLLLSVSAQAGQTEKTVQQMEALTKLALEQALQAIATQGLVYPFALLQNGEDKLAVVSYTGEPDQRPPDEQYAAALVQLVRQETTANLAQRNAVVVRQSVLTTDAGESYQGIWVLTDHRDADQAKILFQTLVPSKDGKTRTIGQVLVEPSNISLFARNKPAAKK